MLGHETHFKIMTYEHEERDPSDAQLSDLRSMLHISGVAPVSDSASAVEPNQTKSHKRC